MTGVQTCALPISLINNDSLLMNNKIIPIKDRNIGMAVEIPSIPKSNPKIKAIVKNTKGFLLKFSTEYIIVIYL